MAPFARKYICVQCRQEASSASSERLIPAGILRLEYYDILGVYVSVCVRHHFLLLFVVMAIQYIKITC